MDWFHITHIWAEKSYGKICFKFRFQKLNLATKSWWAPADSPMPAVSRNYDIKAPHLTCVACNQDSSQVYQQGWMCLNEDCTAFWTLNGQAPPMTLIFSASFLKERTPWPMGIKPFYDLKPAPLIIDEGNPELAYSLASWKGMVCPKCGRCNSRIHWRQWMCGSVDCDFTHRIQVKTLSPLSVLPDHGMEYAGHAIPMDEFEKSFIRCNSELHGDWRVETYEIFPGNTVTHFQANRTINHKPGGAHDMFRAMQEADIGLQRFALKTSPGGLSQSHNL